MCSLVQFLVAEIYAFKQTDALIMILNYVCGVCGYRIHRMSLVLFPTHSLLVLFCVIEEPMVLVVSPENILTTH